MNGFAWLLATSTDARVRDGRGAIGFAERAVAATNRKNPAILDTLAAAYAEDGQFDRAVNVQQDALRMARNEGEKTEFEAHLKLFNAHRPCRDSIHIVGLANSIAARATGLLLQGKPEKAEKAARKCLAIREKETPEDWRTFNTRSLLGAALLGQKKYDEAEPLLISSYEVMKQREAEIPTAGKSRLAEALQRLVQLYQETGNPDRATEWQQKLAEFKNAETRNKIAR
jgi:tetratricopeptide (TPR) repeat protein